jgi:hypothetical protein
MLQVRSLGNPSVYSSPFKWQSSVNSPSGFVVLVSVRIQMVVFWVVALQG